MRIRPRTIFSNSSPRNNEEVETKKISFWLEKLFNQARDRRKEDLRERVKTQVSATNQRSVSTQRTNQGSEEKGLEEAVQDHAGKTEKNRQAIQDMVSNSNRILLKISSAFPFDFFPTSIVAEETRITIIHRQLFSSQIHSVDIKNISNIFIDTGILFAQLTIVSNTFAENQIIVDRLWKKDAIFMRRIIEGLRMFVNQDIDTTNYTIEELINKLKKLSTTDIVM